MSLYRGFKARPGSLARERRLRGARRADIARAIDAQAPGSVRLRGRHAAFQWRLGLGLVDDLAGMRSDGRESVDAFAAALGERVSFQDGTTFAGRVRWCRRAGRSASTWKAARRRLEAAGALVTVVPGCKRWEESGATRNDAAVYVLVLPRRIMRKVAAARRAARPRPLSRPPTVSPVGTLTDPLVTSGNGKTRRGPPAGRADSFPAPGGPPRRRPGGRLNRAGEGIAGRRIRAIERPFRAAGWTDADLAWAVDHLPDGRPHRYTDPPRAAVALRRWRLAHHLRPEDARRVKARDLPWHAARPLPSRSAVLAAAAAAREAEQRAWKSGRAAAAAARAPDERQAAYAAAIRAQLGWSAEPRPRP